MTIQETLDAYNADLRYLLYRAPYSREVVAKYPIQIPTGHLIEQAERVQLRHRILCTMLGRSPKKPNPLLVSIKDELRRRGSA